MSDEQTPGFRPQVPDLGPQPTAAELPEAEQALGASEGTPTSWLVVHTNSSGHPFATRVSAPDAHSASRLVTLAHSDNEIVDTLADHGEAEHGYGGRTLLVNTLDQEP